MGTDIKLKDLYNEEQTYDNIGTVSVPKADGSGSEFYVKRPTISYTLLDPPTHELAASSGATEIVAWNIGDGLLFDDVELDRGNLFALCYGPRENKTTKAFAYMSVGKYTSGLTVNSKGMAVVIYLYEEVAGTVLQEITGYEGATDFTAQIGWGQLLIDDSNNVTGYAKIDDLSAVSIGVEQPNEIGSATNFYALLSEVTQEAQNVSVTENGAQTIVPTAGKSGIRKLALSVNVPSSGGNLQEKAVTFTANGTQEVTPDEGYDGMSKLTATVNVEGGGSSVQANWAQSDSTANDYIKNKSGGFCIPGIAAQTITFDGVETGHDTIDIGGGIKLIKVSDLGLYPANFEGCTIKATVNGTEATVASFEIQYMADYGIATALVSATDYTPLLYSVVSEYVAGGFAVGVGTWFVSMTASGSTAYVSSLETADTSGQMLAVKMPSDLLDIVITRASGTSLGGVKATSIGSQVWVGDRVNIDSDGFLRYPYKAVTVNDDLTDEQKVAARKSINLYEDATFFKNFIINRDDAHSGLGGVNAVGGSNFMNFLFGINNSVPSVSSFSHYGNALFGQNNQAGGDYEFAFGLGLYPMTRFGLAVGKYNEALDSTDKPFVVGGGTSDTSRKNVFSVDWDGNVAAGKELILQSSTANSTKKFKITVDDTGTLTATEVTN